MIKTITYCDKCKNEIKTKEYNYTVSWDDKFFTHRTGVVLCNDCAKKFQIEFLNCKWENMD